MKYSLYLIGSKARGDDNKNSDIDYVCIYDKKKPELQIQDGSISYYSVSRMEWMIENSKLFVKHLIQDGDPLVEIKRHRDLLLTFNIKKEILEEDKRNFINSIRSLNWIPNSTYGFRWGCDYIYTLARNIIYIENSLNGYYHFGYIEAVRYFLKNKNQSETLPFFIALREEKYRYRSGDRAVETFDATILETVLSTLAEDNIILSLGGATKINCERKITYDTLRLLERAIINQEVSDNGYIKQLQNHGDYFFSLRNSAQILCKNLQREVKKSESTHGSSN